MARVTVRCVWRFFEEDDFYEAVRLANLLECRIWIDFSELGNDENGYALLPVFIVSDEEAFLRTYERILPVYGLIEESHAQMVAWSFVEPSPGLGLDFLMRRGGLVQPLLSVWCSTNRSLRYDDTIWVRAEWELQWFDHLDVETLAELVKDPRYVIFYTITSEFRLLNQIKPDPRLLTIKFYFKVTKFPDFYAWMTSLKSLLPLRYCGTIAGVGRHERVRSEIDQIETSPRLTSDTLDTFLKAIGMYQ